MTDFNQKTHDTDVGSHGGQSRQMMEVFENQEFGSIRLLQEAGKTFFCASDVAKALGYVNPYAAVKRHCRGPLTKREGVVQKVNQYGNAGKQVVEIAFIMEGDVYRLIVHSKLPSAERFEHWVFDEVLPSIRKHGVYMSDSILDQVIQHPEVIYTLAQELVAEREQLEDMRGEQPKLRYVFDVADTGERKNSRPVQLWKMNAEHEQPIIRALDAAFDVPAGAGSLENHIMEAAERLARDYWEENRRQISDIVADSYLEGYDELNIGASFKKAAAVSIAFSVFIRTVGNADDYFEHEDFLDIFDFNTQAAANVLGTAVSEMSSQIFREIERTIRTYERDKQAERSQNYDEAELHEERRLPDSRHPVVGAGTEATGQVREDAQSIPAGEQHAAVQSPDPDRETVPAPVGDSGDRDRTDGADDGGASESKSGTGQEIEPDGLGAAHEYAESAGRGSYSDGIYQMIF